MLSVWSTWKQPWQANNHDKLPQLMVIWISPQFRQCIRDWTNTITLSTLTTKQMNSSRRCCWICTSRNGIQVWSWRTKQKWRSIVMRTLKKWVSGQYNGQKGYKNKQRKTKNSWPSRTQESLILKDTFRRPLRKLLTRISSPYWVQWSQPKHFDAINTRLYNYHKIQ